MMQSLALRCGSCRVAFLPSLVPLILVLTCCDGALNETSSQSGRESSDPAEDSFVRVRAQMVRQQLERRDIQNKRVLAAMENVPRHRFVPGDLQRVAYQDSPLPIGNGQTISQPYIVALMTQLVDPQPDSKVLDVGTGSGYQAAILGELADEVYSIEIVEPLAVSAKRRLGELGYKNITVRHGDGYAGWESESPFDVIVVAAAPDHIPPALIEQLAPGGRLVIPVGDRLQSLMLVQKQQDGTVTRTNVAPVAFVPMTGKAEK